MQTVSQSVSQSVSTFAILIWLALDEMVKKRKYLYLCIFFLNMIYFLLAERSTLPWQTALDPERPQVFGPSQAAHSKHLEVAWPLERDIPMIMHWISFCESRTRGAPNLVLFPRRISGIALGNPKNRPSQLLFFRTKRSCPTVCHANIRRQ